MTRFYMDDFSDRFNVDEPKRNDKLDDLFMKIYKKATKDRYTKGYIIDTLERFNKPNYGVTEPETL